MTRFEKTNKQVWKGRETCPSVVAAGRKGAGPQTHELVQTDVEMTRPSVFSRKHGAGVQKIAQAGFDSPVALHMDRV